MIRFRIEMSCLMECVNASLQKMNDFADLPACSSSCYNSGLVLASPPDKPAIMGESQCLHTPFSPPEGANHCQGVRRQQIDDVIVAAGTQKIPSGVSAQRGHASGMQTF